MDTGRMADATGPSQAEPEDVSALRASVPCADRDAILLEVAGWIEEGDLSEFRGILAKRKRDREDAELRVETSKRVRARMADMVRGRMENKVGDPRRFMADVKRGLGYVTGHTFREALSLADQGLVTVSAAIQVAGPFSNTVGGITQYTVALTAKGESVLAQAIEARRAETGTGSVHESAVPKECAQGAAA